MIRGQGQDGWRQTIPRPRQGRPNLGQPGAPLTAVCSVALFPSRLFGVRYSPCTCSPMEAARRQTRANTPAAWIICVSIDLPPFQTWCHRQYSYQIRWVTLYFPVSTCQASHHRRFLLYNASSAGTGRAVDSGEAKVHERGNLRGGRGSGRVVGHKWLGQALAGLLLCMVMIGCATAPSLQPTAAPSPPPFMDSLPGPIAAASAPEVLDAGARSYQQYCAPCHGEEGRSSVAAPLNQHGHAWHHPDSFLIQTIREGTHRPQTDLTMPDIAMPPFGAVLTPEDIHTLIAFFKASWSPEQRQHQWDRTVRADFTIY
jgi:mono/diheme cytochrome c family protein